MGYEALRKEVVGLSDESVKLLVMFARFLKNSTKEGVAEQTNENPGKEKRVFGSMAKRITYIAPDFDTCTDGIEEYV